VPEGHVTAGMAPVFGKSAQNQTSKGQHNIFSKSQIYVMIYKLSVLIMLLLSDKI
jgi:hypothetical protein